MVFAPLAGSPLLQVLAFSTSVQAGREWIQSVVRADVSPTALDAFDARLGKQGLRESTFGNFFLDFGRRRLQREPANEAELAALARLYDGLSSKERLGFQVAALTATVRTGPRFAEDDASTISAVPQILGVGANQNFSELLKDFDVPTLPWTELQDILRAAHYADERISLPPPLTRWDLAWQRLTSQLAYRFEMKMMDLPVEERGVPARKAARLFARGENFRGAGYVLQRAGAYLQMVGRGDAAASLFLEGACWYQEGSWLASAGYLYALGGDFSRAALALQTVADHPNDKVEVPFSAVLTLAKRGMEQSAGNLPVFAALQRAYGLSLRDRGFFLGAILHLLDAATNALAGGSLKADGDEETAHRSFHAAMNIYSG